MIHSDVATAGSVDTTGPVTVDRDAIKALIGSALGYAMDGFDLLILGFMLKMISADLSLTPAQGASLVTATLVGAVIGGVFFGMLSDKIGRVRVLTYTIVVFAVFTGLCGLARGYYDLLFYRMLAGVGLGGEFGIGMALVAEAWPASMRARASSYVGLGWQLGVLAAAIVTPILLPVIGWRGMFMLGIFPAVAAYFIRSTLHEPEVFVKKSHDHPKESALHLLVDSTETIKLSIGMIILTSVQNFGYYGVMIWLPSYLSSRFGFALTQSAVWTIVTIAGMAVGIFMFGHIADRIGRRPTFLTYMIGAAVMVVVYSRLTDPVYLLVAGAVMGFFVNGMLGGYGALMSELYPTAARATAQNVLFNVGRAIGGFGPVVVGAVATMYSFETAIALLAALYCLDILALWFLIPETRGAALS
ncbi:MAG TPA: MFS transporter [Xanthobacteraceae bacterium]|jgi:MFS family permease|nr:MFS transporter [Xanthobacteraceae bacterium]